MFKKIITSIVLASYLLGTVSVPAVKAQDWYNPYYDEWFEKVWDDQNPDEIFGERYTQAQVIWVIYSVIAFFITGLADQNIVLCIIKNADNPLTLAADCAPILDSLTSVAHDTQPQSEALARANVFRPVSGINYIKGVGQRLKIIPEAEAQGFGFEALNPVEMLWRVVRDLTYFLLILAIVAMSFMIMFRVRISPQTVITVQSALPKIIVALILITFSYAIAGFLVDLMYIVIGFIAAVLSESNLLSSGDFSTIFNELTTQTAMDLMLYFFLSFIIISLFALFSNSVGVLVLLGIGPVGAPAAIVILLILIVIILIIMLVLTFKIWFMLIKSFVSVLLLTVIGPIQILLGVFGYGGFGTWVRSMASHLAVFPVTGLMFFGAFLFLGFAIPSSLDWAKPYLERVLPFSPNSSAMGTTQWIPPLTWGAGYPELLWLAVSVVIISLIPKTAEIIKSLIQGRPFAYGSALGEAVGPGMAAFGMGRRSVQPGIERQTLGRWGHGAAARIASGDPRWYDRGLAGLATRRGALQMPTQQQATVPGEVGGPRGADPKLSSGEPRNM